jgi:hypothetical protein
MEAGTRELRTISDFRFQIISDLRFEIEGAELPIADLPIGDFSIPI